MLGGSRQNHRQRLLAAATLPETFFYVYPKMATAMLNADRLSIRYLLCVMAGVGIAISVSRGIEYLRFPADAVYYNLDAVGDVDAFGMLVAAIYGVCLTTFIFAWRSGDVWSSSGKTLALLFATMCVLHWALDLIAALVTNYRMQEQVAVGGPDTRGYIGGIWYRNLAPSIGYIAGLPILAMAVYKTKLQRLSWRMVWIGFLTFALLIIGFIHFDFGQYVPKSVRPWYFELAIGIPIVLLVLALLASLARHERVDWWTTIIAPLIIIAWAIGIALKATGL